MAIAGCETVFYSEEYYDFLVEYGGGGKGLREEFNTDCIFPITERIAAIYLRQGDGKKIPYRSPSFPAIPKCFGLMDQEALRESGISQVENSPLELTGQGILIGFVDTGIDYQNEAFRYEDGSSKIVALWDQTIQEGEENFPQGLFYGREYRKEEIEEALRAEQPYEIVASRDENGHGTFLAGMAAGRSKKEQGFSGVAQDADLVVVKLKQIKKNLRDYYFISEGVEAYSEVDILMGIKYLFYVAEQLQRPIVICIGLGSNQGSHTGRGFLSEYLNLVSTRRGVGIVVAAGNEGNARHHFHGKMEGNTQIVELNIGRGESGFSMEFWGKAPFRYRIWLESPSGQKTDWVDAGIRGSRSFEFLFERTQVYIDYLVVDSYSGDQGIFFRFSSPSEGIWKIGVSETSIGEKEYDLWLPISGFIKEDTFFLKEDPYTTITTPANAGNVLTITAYDAGNQALYIESSRGYTKDQLIKPELAVPGVNILGIGLRNQFLRKSGTSISAAFAAGMVALFFQWSIVERNDYIISTIGVKNYFIRGALRDSNRSYPNREWGYGKANLYLTFLQIR